MLQPFRSAVQQLSLAPPQRTSPRRVNGLPDPVAVRDQQQILRYVPDPVTFPGLFLHALCERRVQLGKLVREIAIEVFALPKCLLRQNLLGDIGMSADQTDRHSMLVTFDGRFDCYPARLAITG